jgi:hypothetical protein
MKTRTRQLNDHPDRDELLQALRTGEIPFQQHLGVCDSCRSIFDFLLINRRLETPDLVTPSPSAYHRHSTLPLVASNWVPRQTDFGKSMYDSWTGLPATVTRNSAMGLERSLRFVSGAISLELVADRTPESWRFAARCYRDQIPSGEFILKIGRRRLSPGLHDCYSWTSPKPPHTIQLLSPSVRLVFDTGLW